MLVSRKSQHTAELDCTRPQLLEAPNWVRHTSRSWVVRFVFAVSESGSIIQSSIPVKASAVLPVDVSRSPQPVEPQRRRGRIAARAGFGKVNFSAAGRYACPFRWGRRLWCWCPLECSENGGARCPSSISGSQCPGRRRPQGPTRPRPRRRGQARSKSQWDRGIGRKTQTSRAERPAGAHEGPIGAHSGAHFSWAELSP